MYPIGFKESNFVLGRPGNMTDEECDQLPIYRDGLHCISCWKLSQEEMDLIQKTGCVYIAILSGETQPPMFATVHPPFINK
jgi:hypothetical protein